MATQDIRIRGADVGTARRLKSILALRGMTLAQWFEQSAQRDIAEAAKASK